MLKNQHQRVKAAILTVLFTLLTMSDIFLTWLNTPDLSREANPLVANLGYGWPVLIGVNLLAVIAYALLVHYCFVTYPKRKQNHRSGVGKPASHLLGLLGFTVAYSLVIARLIPVIDWLSITLARDFVRFNKIVGIFPTKRPDIVCAGTIAFISAIFWTVRELLEDRKYNTAIRGD